jgi:hypothetical protein
MKRAFNNKLASERKRRKPTICWVREKYYCSQATGKLVGWVVAWNVFTDISAWKEGCSVYCDLVYSHFVICHC